MSNINRLKKTLSNSNSEEDFIKQVLTFLEWHQVPVYWTKENLRQFYIKNGGK